MARGAAEECLLHPVAGGGHSRVAMAKTTVYSSSTEDNRIPSMIAASMRQLRLQTDRRPLLVAPRIGQQPRTCMGSLEPR
jgi:hypothetical protein